MKLGLSLKTLLRSPVRTILLLILLAVTTFAFLSQTIEYAIITRELENAATQYRGVGSIEIEPPYEPDEKDTGGFPAATLPYHLTLSGTTTGVYKPLTQEQMDAVSSLKYVSSINTRYMTAGVSDEYTRLDDNGPLYDFKSRIVIEATISEDTSPNFDYSDWGKDVLVHVRDVKLIAGKSSAIDIISRGTLCGFILNNSEQGEVSGSVMGDSPFFNRWFGDQEYVGKLIMDMAVGSRYVFVLKYTPTDFYQKYTIGEHYSDSWCDAVWPIDGEPENYLELDKYKPLRELIEITNADMHTFDMVYTEDINSIMRFADGDMAIASGRALTREDNQNGAAVCVVSDVFAKANKLGIGDTVTVRQGDKLFEQFLNLGAIASSKARYAPAVNELTVEIVGIYANVDGPNKRSMEAHWGYSVNTIFVPKALLPVDEAALVGHQFAPGEFSFVIDNAWDIQAFLDESAPLIEEMGLTLVFSDGGWLTVVKEFTASKQLALIKVVVYLAALAASTGLAVYLFIGRKKKDYAIMRALGTVKKRAAKSLLYPLLAVAIVSVIIGSAAAVPYITSTIDKNNAFVVIQEYAVDTSIPAGAVIGCILGQLALTLAFAMFLLWRIGKQSPLALLQAGVGRVTRERSETPDERLAAQMMESFAAAPRTVDTVERQAASHAGTSRKRTNFVLWYIFKHIRRSTVKSILAVLLAALLLIAIGHLSILKQSYADLVDSTVINAYITGGLKLNAISKVTSKGHVSKLYYETTSDQVFFDNQTLSMIATNNISRYINGDTEITYGGGYDASCMDEAGRVLVIGSGFAESTGLKPGDTVKILPVAQFQLMLNGAIEQHKLDNPDDDTSDSELGAMYYGVTFESAQKQIFTVAGVVETHSAEFNNKVYTPGTHSTFFRPLDVAEFTVADNRLVDDFRSYVEGRIESDMPGLTMIMDTSKLENLRNSQRLIDMLYPMAVVAALLIGGFLCCLLILQSAKEVAIMRVLGTTKKKTRTIQTLEQAILSMAGLILGASALYSYKRAELIAVTSQMGIYGVLFAAMIITCGVICSGLLTRRSALELLQVKE